MKNTTKPKKIFSFRIKIPNFKKFFPKSIFFYVFLFLAVYFLLLSFPKGEQVLEEKPLSEVLSLAQQAKLEQVVVTGDVLKITTIDKEEFKSRKGPNLDFADLLGRMGIDPSGLTIIEKDPNIAGKWFDLLVNLLPAVLTVAFFYFIIRQAKGGAADIFSFGKSKARLFAKGKMDIKFNDVAGADEAKQELKEVVDFLKNPEKYRKLGARIPKGVILVGPPGVGKTMLAKAVAAEANVPFFNMAGSEFMEMLVGVGASRVRDLFNMAKAASPSLIFIDELEAIGRKRGVGFVGGHDEREQTLNQILVEMDGFDPRVNVIVLAATNRPDLLDNALLRPGRFDRRIIIEFPDINEREGIIKIHMRGKPFSNDVNVKRLAQRTVGFSGADIENMLNEAAILAARQNQKEIADKDLEEAAIKVQLGPERKKLQSSEEKRMIAYHEAGHALVTANLPEMDPVHRISIVARGLSLGVTITPPKIDRYNETKSRLLSRITTLLGGRAAEELEFSNMTIGAANDLSRATQIAREMVTEFGMSDLGPISFNGDQEKLIRFMGGGVSYSDEMAAKIDGEIKKILDNSYQKAQHILQEKKDKLDRVAKELMEKESLDGEEFKKLIESQKHENTKAQEQKNKNIAT